MQTCCSTWHYILTSHWGAGSRVKSCHPGTPGPATLLRPRTPRRAGDACMGPSPSRQTAVSASAVAVSGGSGDDGSDRLCVALKRLGSAVSGSVVARPVCAAQVGPLHPVGGCFGGSLRPPRAGQGFGDEGIRSRPGRSQRHPSGTTPGINRHSGPTEHTRTPDTTARRPLPGKPRSCSSGGQRLRECRPARGGPAGYLLPHARPGTRHPLLFQVVTWPATGLPDPADPSIEPARAELLIRSAVFWTMAASRYGQPMLESVERITAENKAEQHVSEADVPSVVAGADAETNCAADVVEDVFAGKHLRPMGLASHTSAPPLSRRMNQSGTDASPAVWRSTWASPDGPNLEAIRPLVSEIARNSGCEVLVDHGRGSCTSGRSPIRTQGGSIRARVS